MSQVTLSVTVVIPTYNGVAFIGDALSSVSAQTLLPQEIIIVDDCSTDETIAVVENMAHSSPIPIRLMRLPSNSGGPAKPINVGVAAAQTELIAVLDQDDVFIADKLEQESMLLADHPNAAFAAGMTALLPTPDTPFPWQLGRFGELGSNLMDPAVILPGHVVLRHLILQGNFLIGYPAITFRKSYWSARGGVDEGLPVASDYDFFCWLCTQGTVALRPAIHYLRREHASNVCNDRVKMFLDTARIRARHLKAHQWLLQEETVSRAMRDFFSGYGYWAREAGSYKAAFECYLLARSVWGCDRALLKAVFKLPLHWLWRRIHGGSSIYTGHLVRVSKAS